MAQTKRKRNTKHRGTAAGNIETRGRTGKTTTDKPRGKATTSRTSSRSGRSSQVRPNKPPSWKGAFAKAGFMAALLFILAQTGLIGGKISIPQALMLSLFALALYVPLSYWTDRAIYNRRLAKERSSRRR